MFRIEHYYIIKYHNLHYIFYRGRTNVIEDIDLSDEEINEIPLKSVGDGLDFVQKLSKLV